MWSGDISPLAAARHNAWKYRQAASALRAQGDSILAREFDAMADAETREADRWDFNKPNHLTELRSRLSNEPESFQ